MHALQITRIGSPLEAVALPGAALFGWMYQVLGGDVALRASALVTVAAVVLLGAVSVAPGAGARPAGA